MLFNFFMLHFFLCSFIIKVICWDLKNHNIKDSYFVSSIALFKNRAFLTLPRTSCFNDLSYPTVIEVPWTNGGSVRIRNKIEFPPDKTQDWNDCGQIQDGVSVAVQETEARLWVLDAGSIACNPKVIVYDLNFDIEFQKFQLIGVPPGNVTTLVVDWKEGGDLAFVGSKKENSLIVLSLDESIWWEVQLNEKNGNTVYSDILAISPIEPLLYLTNANQEELYKLNLDTVKGQEKNSEKILNVEYIGNKMGPSGGMLVDLKGGLVYYLTRDYAVVRWDSSEKIMAESHDVLAQSFRALPYVSSIFNGPQNGIWALVNPLPPLTCFGKNQNQSLTILTEQNHKLRSRTVKLLKFVKKE